ncbi:hypothetical protein MHYP_G00193290 [Metynnis hypsauchen]
MIVFFTLNSIWVFEGRGMRNSADCGVAAARDRLKQTEVVYTFALDQHPAGFQRQMAGTGVQLASLVYALGSCQSAQRQPHSMPLRALMFIRIWS